MAKQLTLTKLGGKAPFADGGLKLSKQIQTSEIEEHEKFKTLFKIDEDLLDRIASSMERRGFDSSQPVHIWKVADESGNIHNYLIDGYTRLTACKRVGIETVPYYMKARRKIQTALTLQESDKRVRGMASLKPLQKRTALRITLAAAAKAIHFPTNSQRERVM